MRKKTLLFLMVVFTILSLSNILHAQEGALCDLLYGTVSKGEAFQYRTPPQPRLFLNDYPPTGPAMREPDMVWVTSTVLTMSLDEKIGQMLMPATSSFSTMKTLVNNYKVGGFTFTGNNRQAADLINITNYMQEYSPTPLLFAIDSEAGLGARVADATIFPLIMAFGAANDPALTEACGRITARESRSLGIHIGFGPVVDVNTEPLNPIISTRAYSDDPGRVARLARGFITGARSEGLLCTFKHYPGHGATAGDSHSSLPTVNISFEALRKIHILPYEELAGTGDIDLVMTAHVYYPAVYPDYPWPATLSPIFLKDILRTEIGYDGLIISDAYTMTGLAIAVPDEKERAVVGVESGLDIILMAPTTSNAFNGIKEAVQSGRISVARIEESVRRILIAKSRVGLPELKIVSTSLYPATLRHPQHLAKVREVCERAFSCGKYNLPGKPPLQIGDHIMVLDLAPGGSTIFYRMPSTYFLNPLKAAFPDVYIKPVNQSLTSSEQSDIVTEAAKYDKVVIIGYDWYKIFSADQVALINALPQLTVPIIYISFGAPYHFNQIPDVDAFYCGYASVDAMQEVAVDVLTGKLEQRGGIPVCIPGLDALCFTTGWLFYK